MRSLPERAQRRRFLAGLAGMAMSTAASPPVALSMTGTSGTRPITRIKSISRRDETLLRLGGQGRTSCVTWMRDDRLLAAIVEGGGWAGVQPRLYFTSALMSVRGAPNAALIEAVPGYPVQPARDFWRENGSPAYYGSGTLAVAEHVYQFIGTSGQLKIIDGEDVFTGPPASKLIYSPDCGATWFNQDGTTPVCRETAENQSRKTMIFWDEPNGVFSGPRILQMGKGYEDNQDGYVYGYSTRRIKDMHEGDLVMFRVGKGALLDRAAYEFFAGMLRHREARWVRDINALEPVHSFPPGWSCSSVVYYRALDLYLMAGWAEPMIDSKETIAWSGPSSLAFWAAPAPWGPWHQVYEDHSWAPANPGGGCSEPIIVPKWIARDGRSFWLVWTDMYHTKGFRTKSVLDLFYVTDTRMFDQGMERYREFMPYYRFNVQRFDVALAPNV